MANFTRDSKSVTSQSSVNFSRINKTGLYIGHFLKAYKRTSKVPGAQSEAIHFEFSSNEGYGDFDIWFKGKDGADLERGVAQIQGLMALFDLDDLREKKNDLIDKYDFDLKAVTQVRVDSYPALIEKEIGVVWQMEEYIKQENIDGTWRDTSPPIIKERAVMMRFCDAKTKQSAYEKLHDKDATEIDAYLDKLAGTKEVKVSRQDREDGAIMAKAETLVNFDDFDIPFN